MKVFRSIVKSGPLVAKAFPLLGVSYGVAPVRLPPRGIYNAMATAATVRSPRRMYSTTTTIARPPRRMYSSFYEELGELFIRVMVIGGVIIVVVFSAMGYIIYRFS